MNIVVSDSYLIQFQSYIIPIYCEILPPQSIFSELMLRSYRVNKNIDVSLEGRSHQEADFIRRSRSLESRPHRKAEIISSGHMAANHYLS